MVIVSVHFVEFPFLNFINRTNGKTPHVIGATKTKDCNGSVGPGSSLVPALLGAPRRRNSAHFRSS